MRVRPDEVGKVGGRLEPRTWMTNVVAHDEAREAHRADHVHVSINYERLPRKFDILYDKHKVIFY